LSTQSDGNIPNKRIKCHCDPENLTEWGPAIRGKILALAIGIRRKRIDEGGDGKTKSGELEGGCMSARSEEEPTGEHPPQHPALGGHEILRGGEEVRREGEHQRYNGRCKQERGGNVPFLVVLAQGNCQSEGCVLASSCHRMGRRTDEASKGLDEDNG
jgi:hypothetical protein